jgi:hypothetical protein
MFVIMFSHRRNIANETAGVHSKAAAAAAESKRYLRSLSSSGARLQHSCAESVRIAEKPIVGCGLI